MWVERVVWLRCSNFDTTKLVYAACKWIRVCVSTQRVWAVCIVYGVCVLGYCHVLVTLCKRENFVNWMWRVTTSVIGMCPGSFCAFSKYRRFGIYHHNSSCHYHLLLFFVLVSILSTRRNTTQQCKSSAIRRRIATDTHTHTYSDPTTDSVPSQST